MKQQALGMIETKGLVPAIEAADAGVKAANVQLVGYEIVQGGLVMVAFTGDVAAVQACVSAGSAAAERVGMLISTHVIPRPEADLNMVFKGKRADQPKDLPPAPQPVSPGPTGGGAAAVVDLPAEIQPEATAVLVEEELPVAEAGQGSALSSELINDPEGLDELTVGVLRRLARTVTGLSLHGREISRANKEQLIQAIREARKAQA